MRTASVFVLLTVTIVSFSHGLTLQGDDDPFFDASKVTKTIEDASQGAANVLQAASNAVESAAGTVADAAAPQDDQAKSIAPETPADSATQTQPEINTMSNVQVSNEAVPTVQPFTPHPLERSFYSQETRGAWSYDPYSPSGPEFWSTIDPTFSGCSEQAKAQSPIDLFTFRIASPMSPLLTPQYIAGQMLVRNTGSYLRLIPHRGSVLYWGDKIFELIYAQIHTPSEHHMAGETFPAEIQFVHKSQEDDQLAVLSLLVKQGAENPFLGRVLEVAPTQLNAEEFLKSAINLGDAVPRDITQYKSGTRVAYPHYTYEGSLTTPPCRENVRWFVWSKPDQASKEQLDKLRKLVKFASTRPLQKPNGRVIEFKTLF